MKNLIIGEGYVYHGRQGSVKNSFRYPTFFLHFNCKKENELLNFLSSKFFGILSIKSKDYLKGEGGLLEETIKKFLKDECQYIAEDIFLQTLPRMFGYAFNPVSFWLCKKSGHLDAVLVEVNNTFGERHFYWIKNSNELDSNVWYRAEKVFHVSPFQPVEGFYKFRFRCSEQISRIDINYHGPDEKLRLATWVTGDLGPIENSSLVRIIFRYGWITPMVVIRIHFQALRLFIKSAKFYRKPLPPEKKVT